MARLRFAMAFAAAAATGAIAGAATAGVHVLTVSQSPIGSGVWTPGVIPALGVDANELGFVSGDASGGGTKQQGHEGGWTDRSEWWQKDHDEGGNDDGERGNHGGRLSVPKARSSDVVGPPAGQSSFNGLDHWDNRYGDGRNDQFSLEPPDQGLCVGGAQGGGQLLELVNNVVRSYTTAGTPNPDLMTSNAFFGYEDPAIDRTTGKVGPQVTDPSCIFDARAKLYVVIALVFEAQPDLPVTPTGVNHIDIAVTTAAEPTKVVQRYRIPVQDDGTDGTPSHPNCPCVGDFPQFGMDENGFYITTNEYPWFTDGFNGAQVYAFSRKDLENLSATLRVVHYDELTAAGNPAFTVSPARSNEGDYNRQNGGTENFVSSMAAPEAGNAAGIDNRIAVWWLRNTSALDARNPEATPRLSNQVVTTETYAIPPPADQKPGNTPLADCLNHNKCSKIINNGAKDPYKPEVEGPLDSSDSRVLTHWYVNGQLLGALDTALKVGGRTKAGVAWFAFDAGSGRLQAQSYLAVANNNVIIPAIATLRDGRGAMAFTLAGGDWYPSAASAPLTAGSASGRVKVGNPTIAAPGLDAQDGFSEYRLYSPTGDGIPRPRWGDFGGAASDGTSVWIGSEYIGQTCGTSDWREFYASAFQCGETRTALANWGTRLTQVVLPSQSERH